MSEETTLGEVVPELGPLEKARQKYGALSEIEIEGQPFFFRAMTGSDWRTYREWRRDPVTRTVAAEKLVKHLLAHPGVPAVEQVFNKKPYLADEVEDALLEEGGAEKGYVQLVERGTEAAEPHESVLERMAGVCRPSMVAMTIGGQLFVFHSMSRMHRKKQKESLGNDGVDVERQLCEMLIAHPSLEELQATLSRRPVASLQVYSHIARASGMGGEVKKKSTGSTPLES